ncbi:MAG TPA: hypothetical protein VI731_05870 [Bacteroidia bacterium]|nr:hypothetical protein [Bacteroidia bacterium]
MRFVRISLLAISSVVIAVSVSSFRKNAVSIPSVAVGEFFYHVSFGDRGYERYADWWHENIEAHEKDAFLNALLDAIRSGELPVYKAMRPFNELLPEKEIKYILNPVDSFYDRDAPDQRRIDKHDVGPDDLDGVVFHEEWFYDSESLVLQKMVRGIIIRIRSRHYWSEDAQIYVKFSTLSPEVSASSRLFQVRNITYDVRTYAMEPYFDSAWGEKMHANYEALFKRQTETAANGKHQLYDSVFPHSKPIDPAELQKRKPMFAEAYNARHWESWTLDLSNKTFKKELKGILFNTIDPADYWGQYPKRIAFLPLNNFVPASPYPSGPYKIEKVSTLLSWRSESAAPQGKLEGDTSRLATIAATLTDLGKNYKTSVYSDSREYDPWTGKHILMAKDSLDYQFSHLDYELQQRRFLQEIFDAQLDTFVFDYKTLCGFDFFESWNVDPAKAVFQKSVVAVAPSFVRPIDWDPYVNAGVLFNIETRTADPTLIEKPGFLIARHIHSVQPLQSASWGYNSVNSWISYAVLLRETRKLDASQHYQLINPFLELIYDGKLAAYDPYDTTRIISPPEVRSKINSLKWTDFPVGDIATDYAVVDHLIFDEDWYFDPVNLQFYKKVNTITFVNEKVVFDENEMKSIVSTSILTIKVNRPAETKKRRR